MRKSFVVLLLFLFACRLASQTTASATLLSVKDGLSHGVVLDILQSRDGFIWIATLEGLNRYDGARFEVFSHDPFNPYSIAGSHVRQLFEDSRGWIWIHLTNGIDVLDPGSGRFYHLKRNGKPTASRLWEGFVETPDGAIWLMDHFRILQFKPQKDILEKAYKQGSANFDPPFKEIPLPYLMDQDSLPMIATCFLFTQQQKLLIGTNMGLWALDPGSEKFDQIGLPTADIRWINQDPAGFIWMHHDGEGPTFTSMETIIWDEKAGIQQGRTIKGDLPPVTHDAAGFSWFYQDNGLKKIQRQKFLNNETTDVQWTYGSFFPPDGYSSTISILPDRSGLLWLGSNGEHGVVKLNPHKPIFQSGLLNPDTYWICEKPEGKFLTWKNWELKFSPIRFEQSEPNSFVRHLVPSEDPIQFDAAGNVWSSGIQVLYRWDAKTNKVQEFPWEGRFGLCLDAKGCLLSLGYEGLYEFNPATAQSRIFPLKIPMNSYYLQRYSHFFWKASNGVIWIFGIKGLIKAVPDNKGYQFEYFANNPKDRSSLLSDKVMCVADDPIEPDRYLWVGTKDGGLNRLDKQSGKFNHYTRQHGLPSNTIYGVLAENKGPFIWLSTDKGLCRFDVRAASTLNFTVADGLPHNQFYSGRYLKTRDGVLIFGSANGLTVFYPDSLRLNKNAPQTQIVGLEVNNQKYDFSGKTSITLPHDQNFLSFDFAALEFTNPTQNQYRYQLVGVDKDWVSLGTKNNIHFAGLLPGTYTFKVIGSNNHGVWSAQPAELRFTIRPPWWASWWAYMIYLALAAAGIWWYYQYLLRQRFSEQEKLRMQELDDFKSRVFTNITHEFRTPLTVILGMTEQLAAGSEQWAVSSERPAVKNILGLVRRNGENLLRLINQILDLAKLESNTLKINYIQGDVLAFLKYIAESLHSLANAQNLMLRVESPQAAIVMDYDPERFLQIIHNLLSNAIKFTPSGGKVVLRADLKDQWLQLSVTDSGAGIPPEELPHLFERFFQAKNQEYAKAGGAGIGLSLTRELVKVMGGEIYVESTVGVGSTFFVKLPVTNNAEPGLSPAPSEGGGDSSRPTSPEKGGVRIPTTLEGPEGRLILLIEDNPDVVEYLSACLNGVGDHEGRPYQLDFAYNGQAGIEKALENVPDLIVSDVMMPFKDGFEVVEALKSDERTSHIPIILLTAKADMESRIKGLRRGADAYLSKPFHQEELLATLENLLEQRRKLQEKFLSQQLAVGSQQPTTDAELPTADLTLEDAFLQKFRAVVEANLSDPDFEMPQLERALGMSRSQIFRKMKALTGKSPSLFIRSIRLLHSWHLLQTTTLTVSEIAYEVGYSALNNFSDAFMEEFGERPTAVRG